jgi:hypothetical protein
MPFTQAGVATLRHDWTADAARRMPFCPHRLMEQQSDIVAMINAQQVQINADEVIVALLTRRVEALEARRGPRYDEQDTAPAFAQEMDGWKGTLVGSPSYGNIYNYTDGRWSQIESADVALRGDLLLMRSQLSGRITMLEAKRGPLFVDADALPANAQDLDGVMLPNGKRYLFGAGRWMEWAGGVDAGLASRIATLEARRLPRARSGDLPPENAINADLWVSDNNGQLYWFVTFDDVSGAWLTSGAGERGPMYFEQPTEPLNKIPGDHWYDTSDDPLTGHKEFVWRDEAWVEDE